MKIERCKTQQPSNPSPMLQAIMDQSTYTDKEAEGVLATREMQKREYEKKAMSILSRSQDMRQYVDVPTRIKPGDLDQKTEAHPNFKDHPQQDKVRMSFKFDIIDSSDGIEMGSMTSKDILGY